MKTASLSKSLDIVKTQFHDNVAHCGPAGAQQISLLSSFVFISLLFVMEHKSSKQESVEPDMMFTLQASNSKETKYPIRDKVLFGYRVRTVDGWLCTNKSL